MPDQTTPPRIRSFALADRASLVRAINAVCDECRWMRTTHFEPDAAWTHALEEADCPHHLLLVVEDQGSVVGWCRTFPENDAQGAKVATLGIGLLPAYRNRGLGTTLVRRSLHWARMAGLRRVCLSTHPDNTRAIHVFTHCGFRLTGVSEQNALEMACHLADLPNKS